MEPNLNYAKFEALQRYQGMRLCQFRRLSVYGKYFLLHEAMNAKISLMLSDNKDERAIKRFGMERRSNFYLHMMQYEFFREASNVLNLSFCQPEIFVRDFPSLFGMGQAKPFIVFGRSVSANNKKLQATAIIDPSWLFSGIGIKYIHAIPNDGSVEHIIMASTSLAHEHKNIATLLSYAQGHFAIREPVAKEANFGLNLEYDFSKFYSLRGGYANLGKTIEAWGHSGKFGEDENGKISIAFSKLFGAYKNKLSNLCLKHNWHSLFASLENNP